MALDVRPLKPRENWQMLNAIRNGASNQYQDRIPAATKGKVQATLKALERFQPQQNEFHEHLVNRVGLQLIRNTSWTNPMAPFKRGMLTRGDTIEEIAVGIIKASTYDPDREELEKELFGTSKVYVENNFHRQNRRDKYKITINNPLESNAFDTPMGLQSFIAAEMSAPATSDNLDEFLLMCQLFAEYEANGGFYKVQIPDVIDMDSDGTDARKALRTIRAVTETLPFMSTKYNAAGMMSFAKPDDLYLFHSPEFAAAIDVEALAAAFNIDKAAMRTRTVTIPQERFGIDGCQAILTTKDFFVVADTQFQTASMFNPAALQTNFWLHHWSLISASRFVPAVMFTSHRGDEVADIQTPVTSVTAITVTDKDVNTVTDVARGEAYSLYAEAVTTPAGGTNTAVRYTLTGNTSPLTWISMTGVLHVGGNEGAATLSVVATATWTDPKGLQRDGAKSATKTLNVVGPVVGIGWPIAGSAIETVTGIIVEGVAVTPTFAPGTFTYTATVPGGTVTADQVVVTGPDTGDVDISVNTAGTVVTITALGAPGDPVYTVTVS
jgi:hypothetical protein